MASKALTAEDFAYSRLLSYVAYQWPHYQDAPHHRLICRKLEAVERGEIKRLMIFVPPRHGKSLLASTYFPAWYLGRNPDKYVITATYGQDLADDFGRQVKNQIADPCFQEIFPGVGLADDSRASRRFSVDGSHGGIEQSTNRQGAYYAVGVGGPLTGRGAHCFVAGTLVETDVGPIPIEDLEVCPTSYKVLSVNHDANAIEYRPVEAFSAREGVGIYRVTTARGRVVEVTGNHPFYTGRGYVEASSLTSGDSVLCALPEGCDEGCVRLPQVGEELSAGPLLLPQMQSGTCVIQGSQALRKVWGENAAQDNAVLSTLPSPTDGKEAGLSGEGGIVPHVSERVSSGLAWKNGGEVSGVLFKDLRGHSSLSSHVRENQPEVEAWAKPAAERPAWGEIVPHNEKACSGAGQEQVRDMCSNREVARPSHRWVADEQLLDESHYTLPEMPQAGPSASGWQAEWDHVISVEKIGETARVFDIQVSENHNFFANGILVHNCLIIDDPIRNRQDADSETVRANIKSWYTSTAYTRLMPGGAVVVIQTRWHEDDLSGWLLAEHQHEGWDIINLPALAEGDDALGREAGSALWPEQYDEEALNKIKLAVGPRDWSALYQQRPAPDSGDYFKREWLIPVDVIPPKETLTIYGGSDYAVTADGGDYTVHVVMGVAQDGRLYLLDLWRAQSASDVWVDAFCAMVRKWKPIGWAEETGQIKSGVGPFLVKRMMETESYVAREQFPTRGDKAVRAQSIRARMALQGLHIHRDAPFLADLVSEMMSFPVGVHDDQVDAMGLAGQLMDRINAKIDRTPKGKPVVEAGTYIAPPLQMRKR